MKLFINYLSHKYINDEEFALSYVRTQINTTDKGPDVIRMELKEKGIDEGTIKLSLSGILFRGTG